MVACVHNFFPNWKLGGLRGNLELAMYEEIVWVFMGIPINYGVKWSKDLLPFFKFKLKKKKKWNWRGHFTSGVGFIGSRVLD